MKILLFRKLVLSIVLINVLGFYSKASEKIHDRSNEIVLKNDKIKLCYFNQGENVSLKKIINLQSGDTIHVKSDDFQINLKNQEPLTASGFAFLTSKVEKLEKQQTLVFAFQHIEKNIGLQITYSLGENDFFARRQMELVLAEPLAILQVDTWKLKFDGNCTFQEEGGPTYPHSVWGFRKNKGFGQPVFFEDSFWGLEYPAGYNTYKNSTLKLSHFPGRMFTGMYKAKTVVFGVSAKGQVEKKFQEYLSSIEAIPSNKKPLMINYNTWETLMPPTEKNSLDIIELMSGKMFDAYGVKFDTYTFDDGWDDKRTLWDIRKDRFPNGFHSINKKLQKNGVNLGLWLSPSSDYDHGPWLVKKGYLQNGTRGKFICQSDPTYSKDLTKKIEDLIDSYDFRFFKFDGICVNCDAEEHLHHLPGDYSKEANVDALIELLESVRLKNPDIYIDLTCGIWLSPWWLQYASSVWGELYDGPPEPIVPTPYKGYGRITTRDAMIIKRDRENPGFPMSAMENLGIFTPNYATLYDEVMAVIGRGSRLLTFYLNPYELLKTKKDWEFLAKAIKWAQENESVLINTKTILGKPLKKEPYGYAHFKNEQGIIVIYNPFITPQKVAIPLNGESGWSNSSSKDLNDMNFSVCAIYPYHQVLQANVKYNETINLNLEGHEMLIVHIDPITKTQPLLVGGRFQTLDVQKNKASFNLYGEPGTISYYTILNTGKNNFKVDKEFKVLNENTLEIQFPGKVDSVLIRNQKSECLTTNNGENKLTGSCNVFIPEGTSSTMHILVSPVVPSGYKPEVKVLVNGKETEYTTTSPPLETPHIRVFEEMPISDWNYYNVEVPEGENKIEFIIEAPGNEVGIFKASLGCWLWSELKLASKTINIEYGDTNEEMLQKSYPLAVSNDQKREIKSILPLKFYSIGIPQIDTSKLQVYLHGIIPEELAMSKMKFQINKCVDGSKLKIGNEKYEFGIGMHSYGRVKYDISGKGFTKFSSWIGADKNSGKGNLEFEVWVDGKRKYSSGLMNRNSNPKKVEVVVEQANSLELRVLGGGDGIEGDFGNWGKAELKK